MARVRFSRRALAYLRAQDRWLRARNPSAADGLAAEVERATALLLDHPGAGYAVEGTRLRIKLTSHSRYLIVYRHDREGIYVLAVRHPRQRPLF